MVDGIFPVCRCLDLSFNNLKEIPHAEHVFPGCLEKLYLASNLVSTVPPSLSFDNLRNLKILELGANKIKASTCAHMKVYCLVWLYFSFLIENTGTGFALCS